MKNITVTVDPELYRRARIRAAETGTTVTGLVREYLVQLTAGETDFERRVAEQRHLIERVRAEHAGFGAAGRLGRDEVHGRDALR